MEHLFVHSAYRSVLVAVELDTRVQPVANSRAQPSPTREEDQPVPNPEPHHTTVKQLPSQASPVLAASVVTMVNTHAHFVTRFVSGARKRVTPVLLAQIAQPRAAQSQPVSAKRSPSQPPDCLISAAQPTSSQEPALLPRRSLQTTYTR